MVWYEETIREDVYPSSLFLSFGGLVVQLSTLLADLILRNIYLKLKKMQHRFKVQSQIPPPNGRWSDADCIAPMAETKTDQLGFPLDLLSSFYLGVMILFSEIIKIKKKKD